MIATRRLCWSLGMVVGLGCAGIQVANLLLIADRALPPSPVAFLASPRPLFERDAGLIAIIDLSLPFEEERRFLASLALLDVRKWPSPEAIDRATRRIADLPPGEEREAGQARLAAATGDLQQALAHGIHAHAADVVESTLNQLEKQGHVSEAEEWDRQYIAALTPRATDREELAAALWRLGRLENAAAEKAILAKSRGQLQHAALETFRLELALMPLSGKVLLTAGYAALAVGNRGEARHYFASAVAHDPASASGHVGLARIAITQQQILSAREHLALAQTIAPQQADVVRLARDLARDLAH